MIQLIPVKSTFKNYYELYYYTYDGRILSYNINDKFKHLFIQKYNIITRDNRLYFTSKKDITNAIEIIESYEVYKKLKGY